MTFIRGKQANRTLHPYPRMQILELPDPERTALCELFKDRGQNHSNERTVIDYQ